MKKTIFLLALLATTGFSQPSWYPPERHQKYWHVGLSTAFQLSSYYVFKNFVYKKKERALLHSIPFALIPGVAKELYDKQKNKTLNREDLGYDYLGVLLGMTITLTVELHF